ncbi:endonuclease domain-containing protein [Streptomyces sp. NPDC020807]|uniref:endonuclease domain-containing protein n=1 Tax=Streptomyces sp. NPDC020807 TaxID=3155119 RepID=UPI0033F7CEC3
MPSLDDLPENRRLALMWAYALFPGLGVLHKQMWTLRSDPCQPPRVSLPPLTAQRGDDGLFHLLRRERLLCSRPLPPGAPHWYTPGHRPRELRLLADSVIDPVHVELDLRCTAGMDYSDQMHNWPPPPAKTPSIRRLRMALIETLGPDCHLCGLYPGRMVDHDHITGRVRGLLCALCNKSADLCLHLAGCPQAKYLNQPPAAHLMLDYPKKEEYRQKHHDAKVAILGFDPFDRP